MASIIFPDISAPTCISVELTTACNLKCRHCYNYWQQTPAPASILKLEQADKLIDEILENRIFHVILTGGEPLTNYEVLTHFMRRLQKSNVSVTMNSNLALLTPERMEELVSLGLPHILTSLNSYIPEINDEMVSRPGAFNEIVRGIRCAVEAGVRVSVNMITTQKNKTHVYETGMLLAKLGATNMFTTRMVPSTAAGPELEQEIQVSPEEQKRLILDESLRVKAATNLNIGSLIQYPVCFLKDVIKYRDYIGRGCQAGRKLFSVHADGSTEACVHESRGYGNVFTDGIQQCWQNMKMWRDDSLLAADCLECDWLKYCEGACRVYARDLKGKDLLAQDRSELPNPDVLDEDFVSIARDGAFTVPERLRWRDETGFTLVSVRGAMVYAIRTEIARFLQERQRTKQTFTLKSFVGTEAELAQLLTLWVVETEDAATTEPISGRVVGLANPKSDGSDASGPLSSSCRNQ
jgi:radical SAM protein with 4Fe4S-binding SPASM domain